MQLVGLKTGTKKCSFISDAHIFSDNVKGKLCISLLMLMIMSLLSSCVFSDSSLCSGGCVEMAAGTSDDYALLKSLECTHDDRLLVKSECLESSGAFLFIVCDCLLVFFLLQGNDVRGPGGCVFITLHKWVVIVCHWSFSPLNKLVLL